jgi:DNA-binding transcriptional LysR family regulator
MKIDLDSIRALDAVVRYGGLVQAAGRLNRVQSAVSYQIRKLEQRLGLALLDRDGYRVRLTPAGEAVLAEARQLLAQSARLESMARQFAGGWEPRLTVIVDGILPLQPTLAALKRLADERIPTRVQVKVEFLRGVQFRFEKDDADLMLVKDFQPRPTLRTEALPDIGCVLCVAKTHPLASARAVTLEDLHEHVELSVQDSSEQGDDRHMFGGERVVYLSGFDAKKQALLGGLGFGWMPDYLVTEEMRKGVLREVRFAGGSRYRFTPLMVYRIDRPLGRTGSRLADLLREGSMTQSQGRRATRARRARAR